MRNLVLVSPPYTFWNPSTAYLADALGHEPPLGLLSLAAYVRKCLPALNIKIVDAPACYLSVDETVEAVLAAGPDVVGVTAATVVSANAALIASAVKAARPDAAVILGGPHVSGAREAAMAATAYDAAVVGEGETTFVRLLEALRDGRPLHEVRGLIVRGPGGAVASTGSRPYVENLDSLPEPAWDLLPGFPESYEANAFFSPGGPAATLVTSRGCPFRCAFCDQSTFGHVYRANSPDYVYRAVKNLSARYGVRYVVFCDDTFTIDRRRVLGICERLKTIRPRVLWSCDANVMTVDRPLLEAMRQAGCWGISFGLESGAPEVLRALNKAIEIERAAGAVRAAKAVGLRVKGLFIVGTPEESRATLRETRAFIRSLPLDTINVSKFTPYPGSALHAAVADEITGRFDEMNGMRFTVPSRRLSIEELEFEYGLTVRDFYANPKAIMSHVGLILRSRGNVKRLLKVLPRALRSGLWHGGEYCPGDSNA